MIISGERVKISDMKVQDVREFRRWSSHRDELFQEYNFTEKTEEEIEQWYQWKVSPFFSKYFTVFDEDNRPIGYLGIRKINYLRKSSTLGIVLDPGIVGLKYGKDALNTFLSFYFLELNMEKIKLKVAPYNIRARQLYESIGFVAIKNIPFFYPNGEIPVERTEFSSVWEEAKKIGDRWLLKGIQMELTRDNYVYGKKGR